MTCCPFHFSANTLATTMEDGSGGADAADNDFRFTHGAAEVAPTSSIAVAMMFGSIIFATVSLLCRTWMSGDVRAIERALDARSYPLNPSSYESLYTMLHHFSVLGVILLFAYICEYHPPFPHAEKSYDRDEFFFLTAILLVASAYTAHKNDRMDAAAIAEGVGKKDDDSPQKKQVASSGVASNDDDDGDEEVAAGKQKSFQRKGGSGGNGSGDEESGDNGKEDDDEGSLDTVGTPNSHDEDDDKVNADDESDDDHRDRGRGRGRGRSKSAAKSSDPLAFLPSRGRSKKPGAGAGTGRAGRFGRRRRGDQGAGRATHTYRVKPVAEAVEANDVLNRDQTEEWKGWMQFVFLLYHYYSAGEVYNSIRIMITCYVWMTGFGNFSFFYIKGDYSLVRVLQMLWRLNFLVIFLMLSQGTTYILYYICPLHTYFFLMVYFTMKIFRGANYKKYQIRLKLLFLAILIYLFWDLDSPVWKMVHFAFLSEKPVLGATGGSMWEWYFRTTLDHWSTFFGMVFALNYPITSLWYRKLEAQPPHKEWLGKGIVGIVILGAFVAWVIGPFQSPKLEYNSTNAYFGFVPLMTFIYFRNLTPTMREYSLDLLHQIGKTTLETYLMQHHIWLTSNAKSLLTLIPGWPRVNMLIVTAIYFFTSRRLYKLTLHLRGILLPNDRSACLKSLMGLFGIIGGFYAMALTLEAYGYTSLTVLAAICVVCGFILYRTVIDASWDHYRKTAPLAKDDQVLQGAENVERPDFESSISRMASQIFGAMALFVLGLTWHGMAEAGAGKIQPLPEHCSVFANDGQWIPINGCNEGMRAEAYRNYDTVGFATCGSSGSYAWGWNITDPSTYCRFARRDSRQLKKALNKRRLLFIGDSMTRNTYHSMMRALGVEGYGGYDATGPKHADISNEVGSINVDFVWAPLASDQLAAFQNLNRKVARDDEWKRGFPDLILVGGGAWDRLHQYATEEDQDSLKETLRELKIQIVSMEEEGAPVTWLIPTTINDRALNTEEKRDHMTELDMEDMRDVYADMGLLSACSFVIDGPSFTKSRKKESYDGVHYPPQVYDAGAQILANAMDWLLPERDDTAEDFVPLQPGRMANPYLGLMVLCFVFVGLMFFDGFMGVSYLASICVSGIMPNDLFEEAFTNLHNKANLPLEGILGEEQSTKGSKFSGGRVGRSGRAGIRDREDGGGGGGWKSKYSDKHQGRRSRGADRKATSSSYEREDTAISVSKEVEEDKPVVRSRHGRRRAQPRPRDSVDDEIAALLGRK